MAEWTLERAALTKEQTVAAAEVLETSPYWQGGFGMAMLLVPKILDAIAKAAPGDAIPSEPDDYDPAVWNPNDDQT
jgi:hypothetical protein